MKTKTIITIITIILIIAGIVGGIIILTNVIPGIEKPSESAFQATKLGVSPIKHYVG